MSMVAINKSFPFGSKFCKFKSAGNFPMDKTCGSVVDQLNLFYRFGLCAVYLPGVSISSEQDNLDVRITAKKQHLS